jgi:hypothetical protein
VACGFGHDDPAQPFFAPSISYRLNLLPGDARTRQADDEYRIAAKEPRLDSVRS